MTSAEGRARAADAPHPLFADIELAARIERAECHLIRAAGESARRRGDDVVMLEVAGGVACWLGPASPFDKLAGLGFDGAIEERALAEVERAFAERGTAVRAEVSSLADPGTVATLSRRGYALVGFENVLGRRLAAPATGARVDGVDVAVAAEEEHGAWLDAIVTGFAAPDTQGVPSDEDFPRDVIETAIRDLAATEGFCRYLARRRGEVAGAASLRTSGGVAQLCGAATLPDHRRRGVQSALLATRLADAARANCDVAVASTQPGSKSQENVQKQGFELLYTRAVMVREA